MRDQDVLSPSSAYVTSGKSNENTKGGKKKSQKGAASKEKPLPASSTRNERKGGKKGAKGKGKTGPQAEEEVEKDAGEMSIQYPLMRVPIKGFQALRGVYFSMK